MGTRADFYVGRGEDAEWLGSIAWDGYVDGIDNEVLLCLSEEEFRQRVAEFFESRDDATTPDMGWPWPWTDSNTTDFSYAFDLEEEEVYCTCFGYGWKPAEQVLKDMRDKDGPYYEDDEYWGVEKECVFPDMSEVQNVSLGKNSGIMIFGGPKEEE